MKVAELIALAMLGLTPTLGLAAVDPKLVEVCQDCHGANGVTTAQDVPSIAGASVVVQSDALKAYKSRTRSCPKVNYKRGDTKREGDMCSIAKDFGDAQIADLSAYFAGKVYAPLKQPFDAGKAATGKTVHSRDCKKCHSTGGTDPADDAGILAGQPLGWLKSAISAFRKGDIDEPKKMKDVVTKLSDGEIEALAHFFASEQ